MRALCSVALLTALLMTASRAGADAIVLSRAMTASTIAEIFIEPSRLRVELEIGARDVPAFRNLLPDPIHQGLGYAPEPAEARSERFFRSDLVFRADGGPPLAGRVVRIGARQRVARDELTGEPLPAGDEQGEPVVFAVLEYALVGRPDSLSMTPPRSEGGVAGSSIGFVVYHRNLPVIDFRYFGAEEVLDLDWRDPWYSRFRNRNLRRQYDAPLNVFLYVEPFEVRAEIIARPVDLQHWIDLGLEGRETIPVGAQGELKRKAAAFLADHVLVEIDGQPARPELDRVHFLRRTLRSSSVIEPAQELDAAAATLGVIFVVPSVGLPQEVTLRWDLFSARIQQVPSAATDEAGPLPYLLTPDDAVLRWQNFLRNPTVPTLVDVRAPPGAGLRVMSALGWASAVALVGLVAWLGPATLRGRTAPRRAWTAGAALLCVAAVGLLGARAGRVSDEKAREIVGGLLHNVYRAFDFREESAIYDVLERSVAGELLAQIYLETRRGLELASQGGARAKVKQVEVVRVAAEKRRDGFLARCSWKVMGSVGHWGHIHQRTNRYEAELTIEPVGGSWKITELVLLQEERV